MSVLVVDYLVKRNLVFAVLRNPWRLEDLLQSDSFGWVLGQKLLDEVSGLLILDQVEIYVSQ